MPMACVFIFCIFSLQARARAFSPDWILVFLERSTLDRFGSKTWGEKRKTQRCYVCAQDREARESNSFLLDNDEESRSSGVIIMDQAVGFLEWGSESHRGCHRPSGDPPLFWTLWYYLHLFSRVFTNLYLFLFHILLLQRMKRIAEEWAVSDKNPHKTRRKNRFLGPNGELLLTSTSSSPHPTIQPQHQSAQEQEPKATELTEPQGPRSSEPN